MSRKHKHMSKPNPLANSSGMGSIAEPLDLPSGSLQGVSGTDFGKKLEDATAEPTSPIGENPPPATELHPGDRLISPGEVAQQLGWQIYWVNSLVNWELLASVKTAGSFPQIRVSDMNRLLEASSLQKRIK